MKVTCWRIPHQRSDSVPGPGVHSSHCRPLYSEATLRPASDWSPSLGTGLSLVEAGSDSPLVVAYHCCIKQQWRPVTRGLQSNIQT